MSAIRPRLGLVQRVLPHYRVPFFEALAAVCPAGFGLFAGQPRPEEAIESRAGLSRGDYTPAVNRHLFRGRLQLVWQSGLVEWLERFDPQVLIVEANPRYVSTPLAVRWMRVRRRPVIGWGLGAPGGSGLAAAARRAWLRSFQALITYSARGAEEYRRAGFAAEKIFVAPNAAAPRPAHLPPARPESLSANQAVVLFVGRLQARKRVDLLLRACAALSPELQPHLWIVGDGPERGSLEALARLLYPGAVFTGAQVGAALLPFFQAADLFVLPGTGGLAVQQALAYALPVMVAEADGTQSDLLRPENGWQLPPGDLAALTECLRQALADIPRLRRMGQASFRIASDEVNLERMVDVFARAVGSVTGG